MLRLENIRAGYGKKEVLHGVSFVVPKARICAILGPNGAGKSTLLKVIAGMIRPVEGKIYFEGEDITDLPVHERVRKGIGYFMQGGQVFPSLTVAENLELGVMKLSSEDKGKSISTVLGIFTNLRNMLDKRAGLLSGGERQALALAMILVQNPKIILLDEPSAGLGPKLAQDILNRVRQLNQCLGITVLLVEHRVREALQMAHRALALTNGTLAAETDEPACWLNEGALDSLFFGRAEQPVENSTEVLKK
jgi:ABC-type branched-subunit amino acid transport system ATPase component